MKKELQKIIRFFVSGAASTVIDYSIHILIVLILNMDIKTESIIANSFAFTVSQVFSYITYRKWVFNTSDKEKEHHMIMMYIFLTILFLVLGSISIWLVVYLISKLNIFSSDVEIQVVGKAILGPVLGITSYYLYKKYVFKDKK
ncbi:GtrA family protein [Candidatus Dojkabacteria bacterium]|jgi:putative flippase GtrA|nr:GtrA family protein [Candidatus Dojkabacteria bacterium]